MIIAKKVIEGTTLTFEWADETTTVFTPEDFSPEILERAMMAGLGHKLGDAYSGSQGDVRKAQMMQLEVADALKAGDWNRSGGGTSSGGVWVEALAAASGEDMDAALTAWNDMDDATKAATKKHPQVKLAKAEIEMARAKAKAAEAEPFQMPTA